MSRVAPASVALLCTIGLLTGCAHTAYVRSVAGPEAGDAPSPGASICVALTPGAVEWDMSNEITEKIGRLLARKGYTATSSTDADYFLFYEFDRKTLMTRGRLEPLGGVSTGIHTTRQEGPFDLTLSLRLVKAGTYHDEDADGFVWVGGAVLREVPTESPKFIDLLLVVALKQFPKDTGTTIKTRIGLYDPNAKALRR